LLNDDDDDETSAAARRLRAVADDIMVQVQELRDRTEATLLAYADQMVLWKSRGSSSNDVETSLLVQQGQVELERLQKVSRDIDATAANVEAKTNAALSGVVVASSSSDEEAMAVEETPTMTVTTDISATAPAVRQKVVMLVSSIPLNRQVQANQEMDITILQSNDIAYEVLDGVEEKVLRNALMDVSGRRGEYPQFFLVSVPDGHATFWGGHDEFVAEHDHGTLRDVFPIGAFSPRSSPLPFLSAASDDDDKEEEDGDDDVESPEDLAATTVTTTKTVPLEDEAFAQGETTTPVTSGDGEKAAATIGDAQAEEVAAAAASSSSLEGSEIVPSSDVVIPTSTKEEEEAEEIIVTPSTASAMATTTLDDEPAGFAPGSDIASGTIMEDIGGAQAKEAVMDPATTDMGEAMSLLPDNPTTGGTTSEGAIGGGAPVANIMMDGATDVCEEARSSLADIPWPQPR
jgi:hypothetical protein